MGVFGFGLGKFGAVALIKRDPIARDVDEEIAPVGESVIHLLQGVDDEIDGRAQRLGDREFAVKPILGGQSFFMKDSSSDRGVSGVNVTGCV